MRAFMAAPQMGIQRAEPHGTLRITAAIALAPLRRRVVAAAAAELRPAVHTAVVEAALTAVPRILREADLVGGLLRGLVAAVAPRMAVVAAPVAAVTTNLRWS